MRRSQLRGLHQNGICFPGSKAIVEISAAFVLNDTACTAAT